MITAPSSTPIEIPNREALAILGHVAGRVVIELLLLRHRLGGNNLSQALEAWGLQPLSRVSVCAEDMDRLRLLT